VPPQRHDQEGQLVNLVQALVERLVVPQSTKVEQVHQEEVAEVDEDGNRSAHKRPAQNEERPDHAVRANHELLPGQR
jgi:hypothetical protein